MSPRTVKLLLASKSPRRRQLLAQLGFPTEYIELDTDEHIAGTMPADQVAEHLARRKAASYPTARLGGDEVLVTADTVVVHNGLVLGKPADRNEALAMLHNLSGDRHTVYTGVCLRTAKGQTSFTESTDVYFRQLDDADIDYYVDTFRPYDKAGSYGIQEWIGMVGVSRIEGCFYNVMGLPVARLYETLRSMFPSR